MGGEYPAAPPKGKPLVVTDQGFSSIYAGSHRVRMGTLVAMSGHELNYLRERCGKISTSRKGGEEPHGW